MIKRIAFRTASRFVLQPWYRQVRGLTLGTRSVVLDDEGRVVVVQAVFERT